jgi:hypothetical protein
MDILAEKSDIRFCPYSGMWQRQTRPCLKVDKILQSTLFCCACLSAVTGFLPEDSPIPY